MSFAVEAAGWVGAVLVLGAYLLVSAKRLAGDSAVFQAMNAVGAAGLTLVSAWHAAWPAAWLDGAWTLVGLVALVGIARHRRFGRRGTGGTG
jgi:hypothetical protein